MNRINTIFILLLFAGAGIIYYPIFFADYLYTDEATQLWLNAKHLNFGTSIPQGRYLTYKIFESLFRHIHTVDDVKYARLFSLAGWLICLPVWYLIIDKVVIKNGLPKTLGLLSMIYLISMPPFSVYIGWAACMQIFIACTSGLVSGYILYSAIKYKSGLVSVSNLSMLLSVFFGLISLFTYQNGFGCFFLPFFIHFISVKQFNKQVLIGVGFSTLTLVIYYFLFKYSLGSNSLSISNRASLTTDLPGKILFLFTRPLANAFHFTFIVNEKNLQGEFFYAVFAAACLTAIFVKKKSDPLSQKFSYVVGLVLFLLLIYLPSLIVKENYSSNRTLFALNLAIFFLVAEIFFSFTSKLMIRNITAGVIAAAFLINAWYNFNVQFLNPVTAEFTLLNNFLAEHYTAQITRIDFICPEENSFQIKYGITQSWDEFGVPSTAKIWVPEPLIKQLVFEKTGKRELAESLVVRSWQNK